MAYIKTNWQDQKVERPHTYESNTNADGTITLIDSFGNVEQMGTPVNAQNLNKIEDGIANAATIDLNNLSKVGEARITGKANTSLNNTGWLTNCVLEAPNGTAFVSGNKITFKKGLRFLSANGIVNKKIQNLDVTLKDDISFVVSPNSISGFHLLYLWSTDKVTWNIGLRWYWEHYYEQYSRPIGRDYTWFNMTDFTWEDCNNGVVTPEFHVIPLASGYIDRATGNILDFRLLEANEIVTGASLSSYVAYKTISKQVYKGGGLLSRTYFDLSDILPKQPVMAYFSCTMGLTQNGFSALVGGSTFAPFDISVIATNNYFRTNGNVAIATNDARVYFYNPDVSGGVADMGIYLVGYQKIRTRG